MAEIQGAPISEYSPEDQAFFRFWYGHMLNDLMQPPLANIDHATARYIWNAARSEPAASDLPVGRMVARGGCTETKWNERRNSMMDGEYLLYAARVTR